MLLSKHENVSSLNHANYLISGFRNIYSNYECHQLTSRRSQPLILSQCDTFPTPLRPMNESLESCSVRYQTKVKKLTDPRYINFIRICLRLATEFDRTRLAGVLRSPTSQTSQILEWNRWNVYYVRKLWNVCEVVIVKIVKYGDCHADFRTPETPFIAGMFTNLKQIFFSITPHD